MPFDPPSAPGSRHFAVIGAGIAGLGAAHRLADAHQVTLIEAEPRLGGHARTVMAGRGEQVAVDTGFIVFNRRTYPHLCALFETIGAPIKASDMSFSANIDDGRIEYGIDGPATLFAQKRNLIDPHFLGMVADILRFKRIAGNADNDRDVTLGEWLTLFGFRRAFREHYLIPLAGAIWSAAPGQILEFPAATLLNFFRNHLLLSNAERVQWLTISGGAREYVARLEASLRARGVRTLTGSRVRRVKRDDAGAEVVIEGAGPQRFDAVVLACHADQALKLLGDPSTEEMRVLGALGYAVGRVVLHDDVRHMPRRRACWSSWNVRRRGEAASVTYWMNKLQGISPTIPLFATLNPIAPIDEARIFDEVAFAHPVLDRAAIGAQRSLPSLQGVRNTWFCGAYAGYGFHEDGLKSAIVALDGFMQARTTP